MSRLLTAAVVTAVLAVPAIAAAQDVKTDWDKEYDFSKLGTFAVKIATGWGNQLSESRVLRDIAEALEDKGWKRAADDAAADSVVMIHGATETKHDVNTFYSGYGGWGWSAMGSSTTMVNDYRVGTLVVDLFDAKTKKLIFRGTATDELSKDPTKNEQKAQKAAQKIFKNFPPKPKSSKDD